jgi:hypothetical protein
MVHPNANGRRDPWRLKLDALNFRKKAVIPPGGQLAAEERPHDLQRRFETVSSGSGRERNLSSAAVIGITASWALAMALARRILLGR